ncbi:D-alanyl-D-alanine-carboxypeptidase/endopeptidase AmpH [Methyloceanibacter sp.]|uniref:D-alanyl-D-alanine- carboxypeptidase/endopeptidase AmpH n=1 Tax=Methyloceanibacter sp. TaxID=1965321 RepID=UPI00260077F1|nr:D-alanyl-D-alanine-carboxypeptidase/endopeptidase AmpH [Methyloceanibacter sp.]
MKRRLVSLRALCGLAGIVCLSVAAAAPASADPLLDETVEFTGSVLFLQTKVPGLLIGAVRNGDTAIYGFGESSDGGKEPDGDTVLRIGSITKAFTGQVLAALTADGTVSLTQRLGELAPDLGTGKDPNVSAIRLIDLATHSAGLPRELPREPGPADDPLNTITRDGFVSWLNTEPLLYAPGTGVLYSNFAFDLLAIGLSDAAKTPYPELLKKHVTGPLGMSDTTFELDEEQKTRFMQGHNFDGKPLPDIPTGDMAVGSGGLYSTPKDLLRWMQWHLDRLAEKDAETRLLDHAAYLVRDNLNPVQGMDESGHMDAMSLAWVVMMPEGNRPLILQKAGGLQGTFAYIAFAPTRGVAAFVAINKFDFGAAMTMAEVVNEMIATLAPR